MGKELEGEDGDDPLKFFTEFTKNKDSVYTTTPGCIPDLTPVDTKYAQKKTCDEVVRQQM